LAAVYGHRQAGLGIRAVALKLTEILLESGLPPEGIQCITGSGGEIGDALVADRRVRQSNLHRSREVGDRICRTAGIKK